MSLFDHLLDRLRASGAQPGRMPARFARRDGRATLDDDDELLAVEDSAADETLSLTFWVVYRAADGAESERLVTVHRMIEASNGDIRLYCLCHLRHAPRQFLASRILEIEDPESGEVIDRPVEILRHLGGLARRPADSQEAATERALSVCRPGFVLLVGLARCDGELSASEAEVLMDFVDHHAPPPGCDIDLLEDTIEWTYPTEREIEKAWRTLRSMPELRERVQRFAKRLVLADGRLDDAEVALMQALAESD